MKVCRVVCAVVVVGMLCGIGSIWAQPATSRQAPKTSALPQTIPIFPLEDIVLFPNASRLLHLFEPRYRAMLVDALDGDGIIGMVVLRPGYEANYEGRPPIYAIGCAGVISGVQELADGRYNIVLRGLMKFRVLREDQSQPYRLAEVEALPETLDDVGRMTLHRRRVQLEALLASVAPELELPPTLPAERLVDRLAMILDLTPSKRLELLEQDGPLARSEALIEHLERLETSLMVVPR